VVQGAIVPSFRGTGFTRKIQVHDRGDCEDLVVEYPTPVLP
jgi:hypothetical protein